MNKFITLDDCYAAGSAAVSASENWGKNLNTCWSKWYTETLNAGLVDKLMSYADAQYWFAKGWLNEPKPIISNEPIAKDVLGNASDNAHKKPNMRTLWEEISEATLSWRGKHEHPLRLELIQIAGICINMIRQIDAGEDFRP